MINTDTQVLQANSGAPKEAKVGGPKYDVTNPVQPFGPLPSWAHKISGPPADGRLPDQRPLITQQGRNYDVPNEALEKLVPGAANDGYPREYPAGVITKVGFGNNIPHHLVVNN